MADTNPNTQTPGTMGLGNQNMATQAPGFMSGTSASNPYNPVVNTSPTPISVSGLGANTQPTPFQQPAASSIFDASGLSGAFQNTQPQQKAQDLSSQLEDLNNQLSGKSAFTTDQYKQQGYGTTTDAQGNITPVDPTSTDLKTQLDTLSNQAKAIPLQEQQNAQGRGITEAGLAPIQSADLRNNAIQSLNVASLISARNGALQHATDLVNIAVQQKYGPIEAQQQAVTKNLQLVIQSPDYTNAEKQQAAQQLQVAAQKSAALDLQKANYQAVQTETLKYAGVADAQTLARMQQAKTAGEVAQIAAEKGIALPMTGRYKDVTKVVTDRTGQQHIVNDVLDTVTGNYVGAKDGTTAAQLNAGTGGGAGASGGSGTTGGLPTIANGATPDQITKYLTSGPDAAVGRGASYATYKQPAIYNAAVMDMLGAPTSAVGGMGSAAARALIANKESDIMTAFNLTPADVASAKAEYKGMTSANTKMITQANFVKAFTGTATDNLDLALQQSQQIPRTGAKIANNYLQWAQGNFTPAGPLSKFELYIYTAAREYAKVTNGGAMSAQGLTDSAQKEAQKLINAAQSPEAFSAVVEGMKADMANVNNNFASNISNFAPAVSKILGLDTGQGGSAYASQPGASTSVVPPEVESTVNSNLTFSSDNKTAYLPRSVWSTLGANQDAVLADAKAHGVTLLIK